MIGLAQDPASPFNLDAVTIPHYVGLDHPLAPLLIFAWMVPLVVSFGFYFYSVGSAGPEDARATAGGYGTSLALLAAVLLFGPVAASLVNSNSEGRSLDAVPNFAGLAQAKGTADLEGEFTSWAEARYGVKLTGEQAMTLVERKRNYGTGSENISDVTLINGAEAHSFFEGTTIRLMSGETELDVRP